MLIYIDNAGYFCQLAEATTAIIYEEVGPAQWQQWREAIDFVHQIKVEVLLYSVK
ncbi:MAG: hypothetical protein ACRYG7_50460 [Janthinobacterium lividum]